MANNNISVKSVMRQMIREELISLFSEKDSKNTFQAKSSNLPNQLLENAQREPRKARSRRVGKLIKGRVTSPDDKRLKANREA